MEARVEAFRQRFLPQDHDQNIPFFLQPVTLDLVRDHQALIDAIKAALGDTAPVMIVLDTLNRSLRGSESSDQDMSAYIKAADTIREQFSCAVVVVHHCGINEQRPRGHTSLTGACDAQLAVFRDPRGNIIVTVEFMKDGPHGDIIASRLETHDVALDQDEEPITSCVVVPTEASKPTSAGPKLTKNQQTMFAILHDAGGFLSKEAWNDKGRDAGIGTRRKADLHDCRSALVARQLVWETSNGFRVRHDGSA
jgi:hypothetical protein